MFTFIEFVFPIMFLFTFGFIIFTIVMKSSTVIKQNQFNQSQPKLSVDATLMTKRSQILQQGQVSDGYQQVISRSRYFATFEFETGDRIELEVPEAHFGLMVEQDFGKLVFQGTQFFEFQRKRRETAS